MVHYIVGTVDSDVTMNAANILKPALSRGEVQVIGATTFNEYRKYIEKDSALERRFQPVKVGEPTIAQSIDVFAGVKGYYEAHHRVIVDDDIVRKTVILSERYITDRFLPDKAIDLLDESCACAALRNKSMERHDKLEDEKQKLLIRKDALTNADEVTMNSLPRSTQALQELTATLKKLTPKLSFQRLQRRISPRSSNSGQASPHQESRKTSFQSLPTLRTSLKRKLSVRTRL